MNDKRRDASEAAVAEARQAAEDLRRSSAFLNLVIEHIPAMVVVKDAKDLRFVLGNRAGDVLGGLLPGETIGKNDFDFFPREQAEAFVAHDREVLASRELRVIPEEPISTRFRGTRYLRTLKMPVLDENGVPKYLLAMSEDITERKQAETALRASEARFRGLLAASPDAVVVIGEDDLIRLASERLEAMFGLPPADLVGQPVGVLVPERLRATWGAHLRALASGPEAGRVHQTELHGLRRDGSEFPIDVSLNRHASDSGETLILAIRDVSQRNAVEAQLRQAQKMEAIGNLTGGLAHDFNNLLSVIIGNLDLLQERIGGDPLASELLAEAVEAAVSGADLNRRLLAFARRQPLAPKQLELNELVSGISRILARTLGGNIEIDLRLGEDVWPVTVDPAQLESCLVNLANNARDAMPNGGRLHILTSNRHLDADYAETQPGLVPGDYAFIEVRDTGTGIEPAVLGRIFEPFFTTKAPGKGTGLGLSMVFGFLKQSGGHLSVYSEIGVGTTFRLYLPRTEKTGQSAASSSVADTNLGGTETILVVEDNRALRNLVIRQLTQLGYRCLEAADGPSALEVLKTEQAHLIFSDVMMPGGMSGYDLCAAVQSHLPALKVLLTSGFPVEHRNGHVPMASSFRLLSKPYRREDLAKAVRETLDGIA